MHCKVCHCHLCTNATVYSTSRDRPRYLEHARPTLLHAVECGGGGGVCHRRQAFERLRQGALSGLRGPHRSMLYIPVCAAGPVSCNGSSAPPPGTAGTGTHAGCRLWHVLQRDAVVGRQTHICGMCSVEVLSPCYNPKYQGNAGNYVMELSGTTVLLCGSRMPWFMTWRGFPALVPACVSLSTTASLCNSHLATVGA